MIPKKIHIIFPDCNMDGFEVTNIQKTKYPNDYKFDHPKWKFFQFDSEKPDSYLPEALPKIKFPGYILAKGKKGEILNCYLQIIEV